MSGPAITSADAGRDLLQQFQPLPATPCSPREGGPVFLYFQGNGDSLRWRDERFRALIADGLVGLSYRGYGGSSGRPTETGLLADAAVAYAFAIARYPAERIVLSCRCGFS